MQEENIFQIRAIESIGHKTDTKKKHLEINGKTEEKFSTSTLCNSFLRIIIFILTDVFLNFRQA